ncbi:discoidin domain-containing protein [Actinophytocola oryzae]|uniref:Parallel beta helix pectate lyase-like protein n=1 Tax=Actinophytocola oryzae TaxID=502181 RepID=A0A4R7VZ21_9PSEU|nr:discoidin domain-containing protein [Actinophytocola oryzae]TDV55433.1 parallel beta helix pectate lyase-like protein [Actinophytocola oryzae]
MKRLLSWVTATALVTGLVVATGPAALADKADLAYGRPVVTSSNQTKATAVVDGDQDTYWESAPSGAQWAQVDLGEVTRLDRTVLRLPDSWEARTQQLSIQTSVDGGAYETAAAAMPRSFTPEKDNSVTIPLGEVRARFVRVAFTGKAQLSSLEAYAAPVSTRNLVAAAQSASASSANAPYNASNVIDGNQGTYWESANNAFPQWVQADLGASLATNRLVLKLPTGWEARTQTITVQQSTNGSSFADLVASAAYRFDPASGNTVTISFNSVTTRYVRLFITANTGWPAGQLSELEVYGPSTGDTQAPTAPGSLAYTQPASGQIALSWQASTDNVGVTGYDIYANGVLRASVAANVRSYTDNQPASATVAYYVRARDAAGNQSPNSNTVTRTGTSAGVNLAVGKPITASGSVFTFIPTNANDDNVATYWEGNANPASLTVSLGANAAITSIVVKLNPDSAWGPRTQTFQVLGRDQDSTTFNSIVGSQQYNFSPSSGNLVTIPVSATAAEVRLQFTANTGAPAGQVAELQVIGVPAANPDLQVSALSWTPVSPSESSAVTLSATVRNAGDRQSGATNVKFYLGDSAVGTASVGALAAGATATVTANIGARDAGSYTPKAVVDEDNTIVEKVETNNTFTSPNALVVSAVPTSDLVASVSWSPNTPQNGATVNFSVAIRNQGTVASASGAHGITLTVTNATTGAVVRTLTGSASGVIAPGATTSPVALGSWTAANGRYTIKTVLANDANELPAKQPNNTSTQNLFVGRGANMPYDYYEAEDGATGGGASVIGPNRTIGDLAGEASGRRAVTLNSNGSYVEWTTRAPTNTLVTRFSIPDSSGGGGTNSTLNIYVNGQFHKAINLTSKYAWLYGAEAGPSNSPGAGPARHIYDEANVMLDSTIPQGSRIRLQKDAANSGTFAIDFVNLEQVSAIANPDPARYAVPTGFGQQDVQNALDRVRMDTTGNLVGVYLPPGDYQTSGKFQVYGKPVRVIGAGPWYTKFFAPSGQQNSDIGFRAESSANGSVFSGFAVFGNYVERNDGPGKVFDFNGTANTTIENIWVEHMVCLYWGANTDNMTLRNNRIRDTFADGINMTNGSSGNLVSNNESRATGDDSFALFNAQDGGGGEVTGNTFENLTSLLTWRAAGFAVYGGYNNVFRNLYVADTLVYSGITISSLDFGIPMNGFGASPPTQFQNVSVVRAGGHFWGAQTFPGIWIYSATKIFQGIRVSDVDIVDPTYSGIMFQTDYVGGQPLFPVADTIFTNVSISGARKSGDAYDAKSGFGIWANELPEPGEGPARGSVTFNNLVLSNNAVDIRNTTTTFTIIRN